MNKGKRILQTLIAIGLLGVCVYGQDSLADLVTRIRPSVVKITTYDRYGKRLSGGTGFCVSADTIITNKHVIENAFKTDVTLADGKRYLVQETLDVDSDGDLALLATEPLPASLKPLSMSKGSPRAGDKVFVVGSPLGLDGTVSDGIVSAYREVDGLGKLIQITAAISPGSSGSPVINPWGEVVGVATLNLKGGQNLNFAISSERIVALWGKRLTMATIRREETSGLVAANSSWLARGLEAYKNNQDEAAVDYLSRAITEDPNSETAHHNLGLALYRLKRFREAIEPFRSAVRLTYQTSNKAISLYSLGVTYRTVGDWTKAMEVQKQLIGLSPTKAEELLALLKKMSGYWKSSSFDQYEILDNGERIVVKNYYRDDRNTKYEAQWNGDFATGYVFSSYNRHRFALKLVDGDHIWYWYVNGLDLNEPEEKWMKKVQKAMQKNPTEIWTRAQ